MYDRLSMNLWVFSFRHSHSVFSTPEYTTSRFSRQAPHAFLFRYSNMQVEYCWNWSCFSETVSPMEFSETLPVISLPHSRFASQKTRYHHARCLCFNKLFRFPWTELSLCTQSVRQLLSCVFGANARLDVKETLRIFCYALSHSGPNISALDFQLLRTNTFCMALVVL